MASGLGTALYTTLIGLICSGLLRIQYFNISQSVDHLKRLKDNGVVWEFSFLELEVVLKEMFTLQGQSERQ